MDYLERLERTIQERSEENISINDITCLYSDFMGKRINKFNYLYKMSLLPFLKKQFRKRCEKENFNKKLFSKILFNNLYEIRLNRDDSIPFGIDKESDFYMSLASHQYIRRELELLSIDDIIFLSWELIKRFKK